MNRDSTGMRRHRSASCSAGWRRESGPGLPGVHVPCRGASLHWDMSQTVRAGFFYFAVVLGTGFVLGMIRVPFLVPRIGERWAELAEMPIMAAVIYFAAGYLLRRYPEIRSPTSSLGAGFLALALLVAAELLLATVLQSRSLAEYVGSRDKISGSVYIALLLAFAVMPRARLPSRGAGAHKHTS